MPISFRTLLVLAKTCKDKEAQKAVDAYQSMTELANEAMTIRVWVIGGSYQVGLTFRK